MKRSQFIFGTLLALGAAPLLSAQVVTFELLTETSSANDMSPDGRYVCGTLTPSGNAYILDTWTGTYTDTGTDIGFAACISDDGTVLAGQMDNPDGVSQSVAGRWTSGTGWESLGVLPGGMGSCGGLSNALEMSADGNVIVGLSVKDGCQYRAFRWTPGDGLLELDDVTGSCRANAVSADGSLMGGWCAAATSRTAVIWTADGTVTLLDPPDGDEGGEVQMVSDDASHIIGTWQGQGFVFDDEGGQEFFNGTIASWNTTATDIADNGTVIGIDNFMTTSQAWIRPEGDLPVVRLQAYLTNLGLEDLPPTLNFVNAISLDGRIMVGGNTFGNGWIINLCRPDLDGSGVIDFGDLLIVLSDWDKPNSESPADLDGSGTVGFSDLLIILSTWGPCPATEL